jgi:hypothetical protein
VPNVMLTVTSHLLVGARAAMDGRVVATIARLRRLP